MQARFPKTRRIIKSDQFTILLRKGSCAADGVLVVFALKRDDAEESRLGITIPKRTGTAVVRNHWKRLIRESFRTQSNEIPAGFDFVIRPKKGARPDWKSIQRSVPRLTKKAVQRLSNIDR